MKDKKFWFVHYSRCISGMGIANYPPVESMVVSEHPVIWLKNSRERCKYKCEFQLLFYKDIEKEVYEEVKDCLGE